MSDPPRIAVFGAGGVGAYFGGRLAQAGADVHLIARGDHLAALEAEGLAVESIHGDFHVDLPATDDPADIGPCDYVLFCVKSTDTEPAAAQLDPLVGADTAVVSLQNGVDNEEKLADAVGKDHTMGGVAYIFSTIGDPGIIQHTSGPARMVFGELDGSVTPRAERLRDWCEAADLAVTLSDDVWREVWDKYAFICAHNGLTAAVRLPIGEIRETEATIDLYRRLIEEVGAVAAAEGVDLPDDLVANVLDFVADADPDTTSSLHYDLTHDKPMELEALNGELVRRGREHDVPVPMNEAIYGILKPWQLRNARD